MSEVDYEALKKLRMAIPKIRHGMLTSGVVLLHDNACPHTAARTRALPEHFSLTTLLTTSLRATTICLFVPT
jgi:hypothetical protein